MRSNWFGSFYFQHVDLRILHFQIGKPYRASWAPAGFRRPCERHIWVATAFFDSTLLRWMKKCSQRLWWLLLAWLKHGRKLCTLLNVIKIFRTKSSGFCLLTRQHRKRRPPFPKTSTVQLSSNLHGNKWWKGPYVHDIHLRPLYRVPMCKQKSILFARILARWLAVHADSSHIVPRWALSV